MLAQGERTFETHGLKLWYRVSGSGPVCVMPTPGWGCSADLYFRTMDGQESFLTMVYLDTRGTGRSERPSDPDAYTFDDFTADLEALRSHLGLAQMLLMGHSMAGVHAMNYALRYPQHCAGLLLVDTLPAFDDHMAQDMEARVQQRRDEPWYEAAFEALHSGVTIEKGDDLRVHLTNLLPFYFVDQDAIEANKEAFEATTYSAVAWHGYETQQQELNLLPDLPRIGAPSLVVVGGEDFICSPLQAERVHFGIPGSKLVVIPETGHFPWIEAPQAFSTRVKAGMQALGLLP